jgi:cell division protein FtsB
LTGVIAFFLSAASAYLVLNYQRLARQTLRSIRVRLTRYRRKAALEQLHMERAELHDGFAKLSKGLALPGRLEPDGRVVDAERDDV